MDDVSGLADDSKNFASFLTVAPKYRYSCVYIFHTIFPEKAVWRSILSQRNIYNIFPATVPLPSVKLLVLRKQLNIFCKMLFGLTDSLLNLLIKMIGFV